MVMIEPGFGHDITPPSTGFFTISASSINPFSVRSYTCGTDSFYEMLRGTNMNVPYYLGSGNCVQLYNPTVNNVSIDYIMTTDSPATTLVAVSISLWFILLFLSYIFFLLSMIYGTRIVKRIYRKYKGEDKKEKEVIEKENTSITIENHIPSQPPTYQPSAPTMMYLSSFDKNEDHNV
jgi:hypothetical protein